MLEPVPSCAPPVHEPEYHLHVPFEPKLPPVIVNTAVLPGHIVLSDDSAYCAPVDSVYNSTFVVTHAVLPHVPSALT